MPRQIPKMGFSLFRGELPTFVLPAFTPAIGKVFGSTPYKPKRLFLYPAFHPFHTRVWGELKTLFPDMEMTAAEIGRAHV